MHVEQLFVKTLIDVDRKLGSNPDEYELLKIAGLLRPLLLEKLLDEASAVASVDVKFRVVKPGPPPIPPEVRHQMDEAWARLHATRPDVKRVDIAVSIRPDLLTGNPSQLGDQVVELARKDFLKHGGVLSTTTTSTPWKTSCGSRRTAWAESTGVRPTGISDPRSCASTWRDRCGSAGPCQPR